LEGVKMINDQNKQDENKLVTSSQTIEPAVFSPSSGENKKNNAKRKPIVYILMTLLLTFIIVIWFLFSAKSVVITTSPLTVNNQPIVVEVTGNLHFKMADHLLMRTGSYRVNAKLAGYYPINEALEVSDIQNQKYNFVFKPLPGHLKLNIKPNVDVSVLVDQEASIVDKHTLTDLSAGNHEILVTSKKYFPYQSSVEIVGKETTQAIDIKLVPAWAKVSLNSDPIGAIVYQGERLLGVTPTYVDIMQGQHELTFDKKGYKSTKREIAVIAGEDLTIKAAKLFKLEGLLAVNSSPSGVSVTYGNKYLGTTPLQVAVTPNVEQSLLLFKDGYQSQTHSLVISSGKKVEKDYKLQIDVGQVVFKVTPSDALLYIDDRLMGRANKTMTLAVKQQKITIKKEGFVNYQEFVLPNSNLEQLVSVKLKTIEQAKWENMKPVIAAVSGSKLKLFKPNDTFIMGASRREQGRRANEVKRTIKLSRPFYLGFTEVTNKEFRQFQRDHSSGHVQGNSLNGVKQPAVKMTWQQAALYCNWLSEKENLTSVYIVDGGQVVNFNDKANGYRMPTEAEWSWAARYNAGQMLKYAWGDTLPPAAGSGNIADVSGAAILGFIQPTYNDKFIASAPVGSFDGNDKGIFDLSGNAAEWMHDFYQIKTGLSLKAEQDPMGPMSGDYHVIRGASWAQGGRTELRLSFRDYGNEQRNDLGFRIARYAQ